jgi:hypothetical protein
MILVLAAAVAVSTATAPPPPFDFRVLPSSPAWTVQAVGGVVGDDDLAEFELKALRVVEKENPARVVQEIPVDEWPIRAEAGWIETNDFDFDGHLDLSVDLGGGSGGIFYYVVRFDPRSGRFRAPLKLQNPDPDLEKRVLRTSWRFGWCCGWMEESRFVPGEDEPVFLRGEDRSRADASGAAGYVKGIKDLAEGRDLAPIVLTVEEADDKGKPRVVCVAELEEGEENGKIVRMISGDRAKCGR